MIVKNIFINFILVFSFSSVHFNNLCFCFFSKKSKPKPKTILNTLLADHIKDHNIHTIINEYLKSNEDFKCVSTQFLDFRPIKAVCHLMNGQIAFASENRIIFLDWINNIFIDSIVEDTKSIYSMCQLKDGNLAIGMVGKIMIIDKLKKFDNEYCFQHTNGVQISSPIMALCQIEDGKLFFSLQDRLHILDLKTRVFKRFNTQDIHALYPINENQLIASLIENTDIIIYKNYSKFDEFGVITIPLKQENPNDSYSYVYSICLLSTNQIAIGLNREIKIYDIQAEKYIATLIGHQGKVISIYLSNIFGKFVSIDDQGILKVWENQYYNLNKKIDINKIL